MLEYLVTREWHNLRNIRCGLVVGSVSLGVGFKVLKTYTRTSLSLLVACRRRCGSQLLLQRYFHHASHQEDNGLSL